MNRIRVAVDAMGGDHGPSVIVPACIEALKDYPQLNLILVGDKNVIKSYCSNVDARLMARLTIHHASEQVTMDESPGNALRNKRDSSMRVAIELVEQKKAGACVSAGNTGALMVIARLVLKTLPGISRPAIVYSIPSKKSGMDIGHIRMLDLGANVDCSAQNLYEFGMMGSILSSAVDGLPAPRVGLLNIGSEAIKGSEAVKEAAVLLSSCGQINYTGYVEGTDIFQHACDVVVCDGFVGNVALKSSEGAATLLLSMLKQSFTRNLWTKMVALIAKPVLKKALKILDPKKHNGASLLGLNGIVIKSHGNAQKEAFKVALHEALVQVEQNVPERIRSELAISLGERKSA